MTDLKNLADFFTRDDYFIDEKVAFFKFANTYKVYDSGGAQIGSIQQTVPALHKLLRLIISKALLPMKLDIKDMSDNTLVTLKRGWTFWMSKMEILDGEGSLLAIIKQKFRFLKPEFTILDSGEKPMAIITGDWTAWNFTISDENQNKLGTISKKWNGVIKEVFTSADKYIVSINPGVETAEKIPILAAAITIDMVLKESR